MKIVSTLLSGSTRNAYELTLCLGGNGTVLIVGNSLKAGFECYPAIILDVHMYYLTIILTMVTLKLSGIHIERELEAIN